jgi:predicted Zn-dependent peptidase
MGCKKYPDENEYDQYLDKHGGSSNACTDMERVCQLQYNFASNRLNENTETLIGITFLNHRYFELDKKLLEDTKLI